MKCERRPVASDPAAVSPVLFCGLAGFSDFFKPDWLQWIVQRQDKDLGCFGREGECDDKPPHPNPFQEAAHTRPTTSVAPVSPENITSLMVVEKLLEQPHPPPSRVKRREKVLPGQLFPSATFKQTCLLTKADPIHLSTPFRRLLQPHDLSRRWDSGGILGLLPDRTGHNEEAALLNACRETLQNCAEHQDLVEHIYLFINGALEAFEKCS